ncbi:polysaccharide deacetylase family protein [Bacteroidia bacterium]|nr:polysaccharide deacetylase family protein [Bacteroidia bacterium]
MKNLLARKNTAYLTFAALNFWYFIGRTFLPKLTWRRAVNEHIVYLTFDDGPHPEITTWVMEELEKVGANGTFFVVGNNAVNHPEIVSELRARKHGISNHTFHHVKGWRMNDQEYLKEIEACDEVIGDPGFFRPPFGQINFKSIPVIRQKKEIIMWDVLSKDYLPRLNRKRALARIKRQTRPGSIIVFHDSEKAEANLKAILPAYLEFLKDEGYHMKVL